MTILVLEGIDGAGKRTQARQLAKRARAKGMITQTLSFPRYGHTFFSEAITKYLKGGLGSLAEVDPRFVGLLFASDRFESLTLIEEKLDTADLLIIDRYVASNMVYQAAKIAEEEKGDLIEWIATLEYKQFCLPKADITVLLDIPVAAASARLNGREHVEGRPLEDVHESDLEFLSECRRLYLLLARRQFYSKWIVSSLDELKSMPTEDDLANSIWDEVSPLLLS